MRAHWRLVLAWLCVAGAGLGASPPSCPQHAEWRCVPVGSGVGEYEYTVDGVQLMIEYTDGGFFRLKCLGNVTLDNPALPRFEDQLRVKRAYLTGCPPPVSSYAAALGALNVFVLDMLSINGPARVGRAQLAGLEHLTALKLNGTELEPDALEALPALRHLLLDTLRLAPAALAALPPALAALELVRTGAELRAAQLARLPQLAALVLRDNVRAAVELGGALQELSLEAPAAHVSRRLLPTLRKLSLAGWAERAPRAWQDCGALEELAATRAAADALPAGWLAACPRLRVLRVTGGRLAALPPGLLDGAPALRVLDLSANRLHVLPSGLFARNNALVKLDLSSNNFSKEVFASLETVTSLHILVLNNNIHLSNSCGGASDTVRGTSKLQDLKNLTELSLRNTSAEVICRDWRDNMLQLKKLDLSKNNITTITYSDLQFRSAADVNLLGSNVTRLQYTKSDYESVLRGESLARAKFHVNFTLICDCWAYWAAASLLARPQHVQLRHVTCARGGDLPAARDELTCSAPALCAPGCVCGARPNAAPAPPRAPAPPPRALHVRCEALSRLPRLPPAAADFAQVLHLAYNNISHVSIDDLPAHLLELDLRGNQITRVDEEVARALVAGSRRLRLDGNPLVCECGTEAALGALRAAGALGGAACAGACGAGGAGGALAAGALALLLAAGAALGLLARPALRLRLKLALHARGWLARAERDDGRHFDVFISFSHGDERFVREQLVARLEAGPAPYRLCVHYRDWAPGGWIPAQIAASVRASRRTLAVVSEHFLRSAWARAELREAHALALQEREPRLLLLLLDEPARLPLDDKLRRYLAHNTYVRWGDPWFWHKLRLALPRARRPGRPLGSPLGGLAPAVALKLAPGDVSTLASADQESLT